MSLDEIKPVDDLTAKLYLPYMGNKKNLLRFLPIAIGLYQQGRVEGCRVIEASESIPFAATWNVSTLPTDITCCRMQFNRDPDLTYEIIMGSSEFINFLIELYDNYRRSHTTDFSKNFYRRLLQVENIYR
ncbi:hypothetical protein H6F32_15055 [Anabaena sp. FACHB-1237]|uniref:type IV pilus biogenesis protein EbsA n=1 Tax=Anabaena sp. FACHB-1237 TaxID=2692769 RepID=UPI00168150E7|nr:type IV pilus biogenesis protein EbsA [Anabaena sp. FACHB-1237]MBD2138860.1 hypothetical protein [Anabaena sp. FACHB-1237]